VGRRLSPHTARTAGGAAGAGTLKTVLITGCSSGIGLDAARTLGRRGWSVFATCRREEDCERLRDEGLESFPLDYVDTSSVKAAVAEALSRTDGALDAVFNNGALAIPAAVEDLGRDALDAIFQVNLFGPHEVVRRVLPAMRARGRGRIVNCSSVLGFAAIPFSGAYAATKHAMEGLTDALRLELRGTDIKVSLILPGPIHGTPLHEKALAHVERWIDDEDSVWHEFYRTKMKPRMASANPSRAPFSLGPEAVTAKLVHALESSRPRARYYVTRMAYVARFLRTFAPPRLRDAVAARF